MIPPSTQDARATGLVELALRCEQATGADRELDVRISLELSGVGYTDKDVADLLTVRDEPTGYGRYRPADEYVAKFTASLDAAMSLIGKDAFWRLGNDGEGPDVSAFKATVTSGDGPTLAFHDAVAAIPALALTAAALRALAASTKDMNHDG
jgi:hypothetical protein